MFAFGPDIEFLRSLREKYKKFNSKMIPVYGA